VVVMMVMVGVRVGVAAMDVPGGALVRVVVCVRQRCHERDHGHAQQQAAELDPPRKHLAAGRGVARRERRARAWVRAARTDGRWCKEASGLQHQKGGFVINNLI
jgi:hypothetical protein